MRDDDSTPTSKRFRRLASRARTLAILYFLLLFAGTHIPSNGRVGLSHYDKYAHFGGYAILTIVVLTSWELTFGTLKARHYFAVWLAATVYGALDEWTQIPVGRTCDMNDWFADVAGALTGIIVYQLLRPLLFAVIGRDPSARDDR